MKKLILACCMLFACLCANASDFLNLNWGEFAPDVIEKLEAEYGKITKITSDNTIIYSNDSKFNIDGVRFETAGFYSFQLTEVPTLKKVVLIGEKQEDVDSIINDIKKLYGKFCEDFCLEKYTEEIDPNSDIYIFFTGQKKDSFDTKMVIGTRSITENGVIKFQIFMHVEPNLLKLCNHLGINI